jgi:hypothetical protein
LLIACAFTTVAATKALARATSDDVSVVVGLERSASQTSTASLNFQIFVLVASASGVEQEFTVRIGLPAGLSWGADGPDPTEGCTGTAPAICTQRLVVNPVGTVEGGWVWDVVAERAGSYTIMATVEPRETDPDLSNNSFMLRFEVKELTSGGSGGSGGTGSTAVAGRVRLSPAKPRAGSTVTAIVRVTAEGLLIRPTRLSCTATIGRAKLAGLPRAQPGVATCRYRTTKAAKGKRLRGAVAFTAQGTRITRRFSVALS